MKNFRIAALALLTSTLMACPSIGDAGATNPPTDQSNSSLEAGFMKGLVTDVQGKPLAGVKVFADHTLYYNTNAIGVTDANGRYRIEVRQPAGTWHATAQLVKQFNGNTYTFDLAPNNDDPFAGSSGAIRNFSWKLTGQRPDGGQYGSLVVAYADFFQPDLLTQHVELSLEPVDALVDGTTGRTITGKLVHTADGEAIRDVPVGRYKITARYVPVGETPLALNLRLRNVGDYQSTLTTDFKSDVLGIRQIAIEVSRP
jgi:hypothetical protein